MRSPSLIVLCLIAAACRTEKPEDTGEPSCTWYHDADGDGFGNAEEVQEGDCDATNPSYVQDATDCDDTDAGRNPRALEICDEIDNNCDGAVDEDTEAAPAWYLDEDGDGYGDPDTVVHSCTEPDGYGPNGTDCDDSDASVFPGAAERCDGVDNDCDGTVDDDLTWQWYADADADGYGDASTPVESCDPGPGWVEDPQDCDDGDATVNPGSPEVCDGVDQDCDGTPDDGLLGTWYQDADADGYGDGGVTTIACDPGPGWVADGTDCDDGRGTAYPGATETCDGTDDDCDGLVDDADPDVTGVGTWYPDGDGDGYGGDAGAVTACEAPSGFVAWAGDCDDTDTRFHPAAEELDCTDPTDWNCDGSVGRADNDGDGHAACEECDDADEDNHPGAVETCDGEDNDCDGTVDEGDAVDAETFWADADADGWGDSATAQAACSAPDGFVADDGDCDDTRADVHPLGAEACDGADNDCDGAVDDGVLTTWYPDADGDGLGDAGAPLDACDAPAGHVAEGTDCDDTDAAILPGAEERCDGADNDCDGTVDEDSAVDAFTWYRDRDEDLWGDASSSTLSCTAPAGYAPVDGDCDDRTYTIHPGAEETCDGVDEDCDGILDEDAVDAPTWYADADGDGLGDASITTTACAEPTGYVAETGDCDDTSAAVGTGTPETCDGLDNDCDGAVDDGVLVDAWADADGDGWGDPATSTAACTVPSGFVTNDGDCDDTSAAAYPGAAESCNGVDDDCDGVADESGTDASTWYRDRDGDGWGDPAAPTAACTVPTGYVADATDCDDSNSRLHPGAEEVCDGLDNDCDGSADGADASGATAWYRDADLDGYGDPGTAQLACSPPTGWVSDASDCDDGDIMVHPGATEVCDGDDDDCDGAVDEGVEPTWYADADGDGWGDAARTATACLAPSGFVSRSGDCDDAASDVNPDATEACNGSDDDCDGATDESGATGAPTWYRDRDGDGFGDAASGSKACAAPSGYVADATDCDDRNSTINPDASEVCDGGDDDCDGAVDEADAIDAATWYTDADGDGYGDASRPTAACDAPTGTVADASDCDDADGDVHPGAPEVCDEADQDCDGVVDDGVESTWYLDVDGDSFGTATDTVSACVGPRSYVADGGDCDDADVAVNPMAVEVCDTVDNDCDGTTDETDAADATPFYRDADTDGYGDADTVTRACSVPTGYVADATDCDDTERVVNPGAPEICDGQDNDCDGSTDEGVLNTWYADTDGDGWGTPATSTTACTRPTGYVATSTDCDDGDATIHPEAAEYCDGLDTDCDTVLDEGDAVDADTWYLDYDGDGYGATTVTTTACTRPASYVADATDCDDLDAGNHPGATEVCDGEDDDCDGRVDTSATDAPTWYADADGDGYGTSTTTTHSCTAPTGYVAGSTDCDDGAAGVHPGAAETCNGTDDDCDGTADDGVLGADPTCAAEDCTAILLDDPTAPSGSYYLEAGTYWCDMDTSGGGWTLIDTIAVWGTGYDSTYYNTTERFTWDEVLFAYNSGSAHAHCTYPSSMTGCNNLGFQFDGESWAGALNWGSSVCGMTVTSAYTSATTYVDSDYDGYYYDFIIARTASTDTIRLGTLEGISYCTVGDNPGTAYVDVLVRH